MTQRRESCTRATRASTRDEYRAASAQDSTNQKQQQDLGPRTWRPGNESTPSGTRDGVQIQRGPDRDNQREKKPLDPSHSSFREGWPYTARDARETPRVFWRRMQKTKDVTHREEYRRDDDTYAATC